MQQEFMGRAIELSRIHMRAGEGGPFGAVIVKGGAIVSEGYNDVITGNDPTAHAEIMAIRRAASRLGDFHLEGCEIYTSCEPCPMCLAAIYWARIEKIYFGNTAEAARELGFDDELIYQRTATAGGGAPNPLPAVASRAGVSGFPGMAGDGRSHLVLGELEPGYAPGTVRSG